MEWDDLKTFLMVGRHGTLSGAARALRVEQSTMGRRLAAMEQRLGVRLLEKTPQGYVMTASGKSIVENVERIENETLAIERIVSGKDVRLEGCIRLTTIETLGTQVLIPILTEFHKIYPSITVELSIDAANNNLNRREADLALRLSRATEGNLVSRKVGTLSYGIYASAGYLQMYGQPDWSKAAADHRILLPERDLSIRPEFAWFSSLTHNATVAFRSNSRTVLAEAVRNSMGIALMLDCTFSGTDVARIKAPGQPADIDMFVVVHRDLRHVPRIRALSDFLATRLKTIPKRGAEEFA